MNRLALALLPVLGLTTVVLADDVTIDVVLDEYAYVDQNSDPQVGSFELGGQSAFIQYRINSGTSGNPLDGVITPGTSIFFIELFPPPVLSDYIDFSYFGIVNTYAEIDAGGDLLDTSLVVAIQPGVGVGAKPEDFFTETEATLVTAFTTEFDSPEFLEILNNGINQANTRGTIGVPPISRPGQTLDLIAFIGGRSGEEGVKIGTVSMTVIPEPASVALLALGSSIMLIRRKRA